MKIKNRKMQRRERALNRAEERLIRLQSKPSAYDESRILAAEQEISNLLRKLRKER